MENKKMEGFFNEKSPLSIRNITFILMALAIVFFFIFRTDSKNDQAAEKVQKFNKQHNRLMIRILMFQSVWTLQTPDKEKNEAIKAVERQITLLATRTDLFKESAVIQKYLLLEYLGAKIKKTVPEKGKSEKVIRNFNDLYIDNKLIPDNAPLLSSPAGELARLKLYRVQNSDKKKKDFEKLMIDKVMFMGSLLSLAFLVLILGHVAAVVSIMIKRPKPVFIEILQKFPLKENRVLLEAVILYLFIMFPIGGAILRPQLLEFTDLQYNMLLVPFIFVITVYYVLKNIGRENLILILFGGKTKTVFIELFWGIVGFFAVFPLAMMTLIVSLVFFGGADTNSGGRFAHPVAFEMEKHFFQVLFIAVFLAPVVEECIFRSFLYGYFRRYYRILGAGLMSGTFFAIFHPQGYAALPYLIVLGLGLAIIRELRPGVIAPVVTHMMVNGIAVVGGYFLQTI